jgi:CheY-like chemotaxis protein
MLKILVLDDDPGVAAMVRQQLEVDGYASVHASDVEAAWGLVLTQDPDAAIVDLWIGGVQAGWDLIERIRKNDSLATLPIVVVTGATGPESAERAKALGCEFLAKPFSSPALTDRLERAIRAAGRSPGRRTVRIVLLVGSYRMEGSVHIAADLPRFTDAWEAVIHDSRDFVPVTDVTVTTLDGVAVTKTDMLAVRKAEILAAHPLD